MLLTELWLTNVDQHVCVGAVAHWEVIVMSTIVVLYGLLLGASRHNVIIKLTPLEKKRKHDRERGRWKLWKGDGCGQTEMRRRIGEGKDKMGGLGKDGAKRKETGEKEKSRALKSPWNAFKTKYHKHAISGCKVYKKNCPHYWFLDTHFAVSFWVKIDDVVTAMVVPAVH